MDKEALVKMGQTSPYFGHLNMSLVEAGEGRARMTMAIKPHHANIDGVVHGGAIASLADQAAMRAVQSLLSPGQTGRTIQMDIHYLAPAQGGQLLGNGRVQKMGKKIAFSDARVLDEQGNQIAMARCTVMISQSKTPP
jgi:uncharacterized protein (TIGR00369 family)